VATKRQTKTETNKTTTRPNTSRFWRRALPLIAFAAAFLAYLNTLGHGFVFDDMSLILQNPHVTELRWADILSTSEYRPVRTFTYALNYLVGGADPFGYHLLNVVLHAVNAVLVYFLFLVWSRMPPIAFVGALIFALHPVQTAAVAYVSGRKDVLATLFVLVACHSYTSFRLKGGKLRLVLAFVFFVLGVLAKEVAAVFPVLVLLMDVVLLRSANEEGNADRSLLRRLASVLRRRPVAYAAAGVFFLGAAYYAVFLIKASRMIGFWGGSPAVHYGTSFKLFAHYLKLTLLPRPLIADYRGQVFNLSSGFLDPATLVSVATLVGFIILAVKVERRHPHSAFGLLWFLVALVPVLQFIPFHELAADHFLYLPLVGMAFAGGNAFHWLAEAHGRRLRDALVLCLVVVFSILTIQRNSDWKDEQSLWTATYETAPGSFRANQYLGQIHFPKNPEKAIEHTKRAIELDPKGGTSWANLGAMYRYWAADLRAAKRLSEAEAMDRTALQYIERAIRLNPRDLWAYATRGQAYRELGEIAELSGDVQEAQQHRAEAVASFQKAVEIGSENPSFPLIWLEYGRVFMDAGQYDQAINHLLKSLAAFPNHSDVLESLGTCYFNVRDYREAVRLLSAAVKRQPKIETIGMLARSYEELGENQEAIRVYREALVHFPRSVEFHYNLGVLYHRVGEMKDAVEHLEKALDLFPNGPLAGNIRRMLEIIRSVSVEVSEVEQG